MSSFANHGPWTYSATIKEVYCWEESDNDQSTESDEIYFAYSVIDGQGNQYNGYTDENQNWDAGDREELNHTMWSAEIDESADGKKHAFITMRMMEADSNDAQETLEDIGNFINDQREKEDKLDNLPAWVGPTPEGHRTSDEMKAFWDNVGRFLSDDVLGLSDDHIGTHTLAVAFDDKDDSVKVIIDDEYEKVIKLEQNRTVNDVLGFGPQLETIKYPVKLSFGDGSEGKYKVCVTLTKSRMLAD